MLEKNKVYTLSEICSILRESQEFKPKRGEKVESENKKNNEKAVNDILKQGKKFDGGLSDKAQKRENPRDVTDFNKTTLEYDFAYEPSKEYKDRVKSQVHGFSSAKNEKDSKAKEENKGLDFEGNEDFYKTREEVAKERDKRKYALKASGLQTSKEIEKNKEFDKELKDKTLFKNNQNESKKMKRLHFSKTVFLNEEHMIKKIPEDMKVNGNKFYMKDAVGNEYLVECVQDKAVKDYLHTNVLSYENKQKINESFEHMKHLYSYKSSDTNKSTSMNENKMVGKMLNEAKEKLVNSKVNDGFLNTLVESAS